MSVATTWASHLRAERGWGPLPVVAAARCLRGRYPRSGCARCAAVCPVAAVALVAGGATVTDRCIGCEACVTACPTGAVAPPPEVQARRATLAIAADGVMRVSCVRQAGHAAAQLTVGCLAGLSLAALLAPFGRGARRVEVERGGCAGCALAELGCRVEATLAQARALLAAYRFDLEALVEVAAFSPSTIAAAARVGRRDLFRRLGVGARETIACLRVPVAEAGGEEGGVGEGSLAASLAELGQPPAAARLPEAVFAGMVCATAACFGCTVCAAVCPTGALRRAVAGTGVQLCFTAARCVGCGVCADACLAGALRVVREVAVEELLAGGETTLVEVVAHPCRLCGTPFTGIAGALCEGCLARGRGLGRLRGGPLAGAGAASTGGRRSDKMMG